MKISQSVLQRSRLGQLLIENKLITAEQLEEATRLQQTVGKRLGEILVEQGLVAEKQINRVLRKQKMLRMLAVVATILVAPFPMARAGDLSPGRDLYTATQQDLINTFETQASLAGTTGSRDIANVVQVGGEANLAIILQSGNQDTANIVQSGGTQNTAFVNQRGNNDVATVNQSGNRNVALIAQR